MPGLRRTAVRVQNGLGNDSMTLGKDPMKPVTIRLALVAFTLVGAALVGPRLTAQVYNLPNNDADCPANCRQIPWRAGSDLWNGGTLPVYPGTNCSGLVEGNGSTNNAATIQSCINSASADTAVVIPPGMYYVNSTINLKARVVLRGAGGGPGNQGTWISSSYSGDVGGGSKVTTLKFGAGGGIQTPGSESLGSSVSLSSGFNKGSTTLAASSSPGVSVGDWIVISELQGDNDLPSSFKGDEGNCEWCGESDNSGRVMSQIVQVTSVSGNNVGISRPMYYTFKSSLSPRFRKLNGTTLKTGVEGMKLWGSTNSRRDPHIGFHGCIYCWVKGVETYNTPDVAKAYPVYMEMSYGAEIRDSYFHFGQTNDSDTNYGIGMFGPNSDHKVENNILRENRHSLSQEGGGSGNAFLYNYIDDNWTEDSSYVGSPVMNHGAHPYMTLVEGNIVSHFHADYDWGTSSHLVMFRNWFWGDATGNYSRWSGNNPSWGFVAMEIERLQHFYSAVGNVLGNPNLHTNWSNATLLSTNCNFDASRSNPTVYGFGCNGSFDADVRNTMILHGNYDYKTKGVAHWDGGSQHNLKSSMYYSSKPAFFGNCAWPAFGPDLSSVTNKLPAKARYEGDTSCGSSGGGTPSAPASPTSLTTTVL
jgi:Pectate lyase superfamily protein